MSDNETPQEGQKTVVAFVAGLLIGGLLVWVFSDTPAAPTDTVEGDTTTEVSDDGTPEPITGDDQSTTVIGDDDEEDETPAMEVGEGAIDVDDQPAGSSVTLDSATFPTSDGWIAVRSYPNGQLGSILGAARYSESQGLIPQTVPLLAPTTAGREYAVVFFTEDGDREFNLANDVQIDGFLTTFTAE